MPRDPVHPARVRRHDYGLGGVWAASLLSCAYGSRVDPVMPMLGDHSLDRALNESWPCDAADNPGPTARAGRRANRVGAPGINSMEGYATA